jgi:hypothetical protein
VEFVITRAFSYQCESTMLGTETIFEK